MTTILREFSRVLESDMPLSDIDQHMAIYIALHFPIYSEPVYTGKCEIEFAGKLYTL